MVLGVEKLFGGIIGKPQQPPKLAKVDGAYLPKIPPFAKTEGRPNFEQYDIGLFSPEGRTAEKGQRLYAKF